MTVQEFSDLVSECVFMEIESVESIDESAGEGVFKYAVRLTGGQTFHIAVSS